MQTVLLVIHVLIALGLITVVLLQKSEGGGLGMSSGSSSSFMSGRSVSNLLTRTTAILFACFIATSVLLAVLAGRQHSAVPSILDRLPIALPTQTAPATAPAASAKPAAPAAKPAGGVPLAN